MKIVYFRLKPGGKEGQASRELNEQRFEEYLNVLYADGEQVSEIIEERHRMVIKLLEPGDEGYVKPKAPKA